MKTPEEYFKDSTELRHSPATSKQIAIKALKDMQSDHEKELVGFAEYYDSLSPIEKCTGHSPNGSGAGLYLKPTKELLTQFRKG